MTSHRKRRMINANREILEEEMKIFFPACKAENVSISRCAYWMQHRCTELTVTFLSASHRLDPSANKCCPLFLQRYLHLGVHRNGQWHGADHERGHHRAAKRKQDLYLPNRSKAEENRGYLRTKAGAKSSCLCHLHNLNEKAVKNTPGCIADGTLV